MGNTDDWFDKPLSDDAEENLRMENELLRLKLQAELGANAKMITPVDPQIENVFLKHILDFERHQAESKQIKISELLGNPVYKRANELSDEQVDLALQDVTGLLLKNNIIVDYRREYSSRIKYRFVIEELFEQETNDFMIPGMISRFIYEEFHPDHQADIERRALSFLSQWFKQSIDEKSWELADSFISPDRTIYMKNEVVSQFKQIFRSYTAFTDEKYLIKGINFEMRGHKGFGHAEGIVKYKAVLENNELIHFEGPFKLYFSLEGGWWSIFHIFFPGFTYPDK